MNWYENRYINSACYVDIVIVSIKCISSNILLKKEYYKVDKSNLYWTYCKSSVFANMTF